MDRGRNLLAEEEKDIQIVIEYAQLNDQVLNRGRSKFSISSLAYPSAQEL